MKKALVHIGSGKTGTSSIQSALFRAKQRSELVNFDYPVVQGNGHQAIEILFKDYKRVSRGIKTKFSREEELASYRNIFEKKIKKSCEQNNVLLSSEFMFNFNVNEVEKFKNFLSDLGFDCFKVVVYLRDPALYYLSLVQQKVKASYKIPSPYEFYSKYEVNLSNWIEVFGEDVVIKKFDKEYLVNGNVVEDFSLLINEFFNADIQLFSNSTNESVSAEGMVLLQDFRKLFFREKEDRFCKESDLLLKKIRSIEVSFPGSKPVLKKEYLDIITQKNSFFKKFFSPKEIMCERVSSIDEGVFSGDIVDLLQDFDEMHYKFLLHKIAFDTFAKLE